MSLTGLARSEIARTGSTVFDRRAENIVFEAVSRAPAMDIPTVRLPELLRGTIKDVTQVASTDTQASNALESLVKYIPTESATLYVAAVSAHEALERVWEEITPEVAYWSFAVLTPVLLLVILAGKRSAQGLTALPGLSQWPWWKLTASFIAFLVWGLAVPSNPYVRDDALLAAACAFFAVFISTILTLLEPLFERPPRAVHVNLLRSTGPSAQV